MKKSAVLRWILIVGGVGLALACALLVISLIYAQMRVSSRVRSNAERPLVLIHNPLNNAELAVGQGVQVHATARLARGVERLEFWVDGRLDSVQRSQSGQPVTPLTLVANWQPMSAGTHVLTLRAFSADGTEGRALVSVQATGSSRLGLGRYVVQEGDSFESIAEAAGVTVDELEELNPDVDPGGIAAGDELVVPGGEEDVGEERAAEAGSETEGEEEGGAEEAGGDEGVDEPLPAGDGEEGGTTTCPLELLFGGIMEDLFGEPAEDAVLAVEALNLESGAAYEGLHCYVGMGAGDQRWYPDTDSDQTTDESFASLGANRWDVAEYLAGEAVTFFTWPGDEDLPFDITCVGIQGGGLDAVELGSVNLDIPPENWDAVPRTANSEGGEGSFTLEYRVINRGYDLFLDPDMTPPSNLTLDETDHTLHWDYRPRDDEEPVDGFRIYLNNTLQWSEAAEDRQTVLPEEWFRPPCGEHYDLTVTAFRLGYPDGPESPQADPPATTRTDVDECQRQVTVTFETLVTHNLPDDSSIEPNDIGPVYGSFYANEDSASFDGGPGILTGRGLDKDSRYPINGGDGLTEASYWHGDGPAQFTIDIAEDQALLLGFQVMDRDMAGGDDTVCEGERELYYDDLVNLEGELIRSGDGRCEVVFSLVPISGPVGEAGGGAPLPFIGVEDIHVDEASRRLTIDVQNTGNAQWPLRPLEVEVTRRSGESLGIFTWNNYDLGAGGRDTLENPEMVFDAPLDFCVNIDPNDNVPELYEVSGALHHTPVCEQLPDLKINSVEYDSTGGGRLRVEVQNSGEGIMERRTLALDGELPDGNPAYLFHSWPNITLERDARRTFEISGVGETMRTRLSGGYTMIVNPEHGVVESNYENNTYDVQETRRFWVDWYEGCGSSFMHSVYHRYSMHLTADVVGGASSRRVADWGAPSITFWSPVSGEHSECWQDGVFLAGVGEHNDFITEAFDVAGDERLVINVHSYGKLSVTEHDYGSVNIEIDPTDDSDSQWHLNYESCFFSDIGSSGMYPMRVNIRVGSHDAVWTSVFGVCRSDR